MLRPVRLPSSLLGWACLLFVTLTVGILLHYLVRAPALNLKTKLVMALGLGVLPMLAAVTSTAEGMHRTTEREFCGSCHVMGRHVSDSEDPTSTSLAALHAQNPFFGDRNCYTCHADYGMLGYPLTKLNGLKHVYYYYLGGYRNLSLEQALKSIHLYKPYSNVNCMQCHSGEVPHWREVPEHVALGRKLADNEVSCASEGCHGYAHPFSKTPGAPLADANAASPFLP